MKNLLHSPTLESEGRGWAKSAFHLIKIEKWLEKRGVVRRAHHVHSPDKEVVKVHGLLFLKRVSSKD